MNFINNLLKLIAQTILMLMIVVSIFGKCKKSNSSSKTVYTLKIQKLSNATRADSITAVWSGDSATDEQLTAGIQIPSGTSVTFTAHSAQPNIFWNNTASSGKTFTIIINRDITVKVDFYSANFYSLTLNTHAGYSLKAYTNPTLTDTVSDLTKIQGGKTIYVLVKPNVENAILTNVFGADSFSDRLAIVRMTSNKTITVSYILDDDNFQYIQNGYSYIVTGYKGSFQNIEIPATLYGLPVAKIATNGNQSGFSFIRFVIIPNTVTAIGDSAFIDCNTLSKIVLSNRLMTIGNYAFSSTSLSKITLPNNITTIRTGTFRNCTSLTNITLPNSITTIGSGAFYGCLALNHLAIPSTVDTIYFNAFYNCQALTNIVVESTTPPILINNISFLPAIFGSDETIACPALTIAVSDTTAYKKVWTNMQLLTNGVQNSGRTAVIWSQYSR